MYSDRTRGHVFLGSVMSTAQPVRLDGAVDAGRHGLPVHARICQRDLPLAAALSQGPCALAVITQVVGASYRPLGAVMVVDAQGQRFGNLSSGCIESDVALHAVAAMADGQIRRLRYGAGSPFLDLQLPCGGGLDIMILPNPDRTALATAADRLARRQVAELDLGDIRLTIEPELQVLIFGKGPETRALSQLAAAAGYEVQTFSPDPETLDGLPSAQLLAHAAWPRGVEADRRTAVALFFHDHDWEPPLLEVALKSQAFYVGAQGSLRAHQNRCAVLQARGMEPQQIGRMTAPFGLIPSLRDPQSLAVSVLAQLLERSAKI